MTLNVELLDQVHEHIKRNTQAWNQSSWAFVWDEIEKPPALPLEDPNNPACGTTMCFAGTTVALSGYRLKWQDEGDSWCAFWCISPDGDKVSISRAAADLLGLTEGDKDDLFLSTGTDLEELQTAIDRIKARHSGAEAL